ncbi:MAG TPA: magnesium chelatase ATPase subunit I [Pyrinomonadaceae bacterium]|nr:magnesium chelatase ATPase subunit I [Pyrinomonadaceae bacterium]
MTTRPRAKKRAAERGAPAGAPRVYPFAAVVGQEEMKLALVLGAVEPLVGGVLVMGHRGTGKSTAVRALAELLPPLRRVSGCVFNCDPEDAANLCPGCLARLDADGRLPRERAPVPVVELPLGATEDRVCGTIDIGRALRDGARTFEPGLLARANRGFLYVDEVNLLEDHLVDLLLDVSASGRNVVEREGVSFSHPSRFVLVGSGNPEEGDLRPQLQDRFGLSVEVRTDADIESRVEVVERRMRFERDPEAFAREWETEQESLRTRLARARRTCANVELPAALLRAIAGLCARHEVDGHRGELTIARASRALAAFEGRKKVTADDVRRVAPLALRHRLRRDPLARTPGGAHLDESVRELFGGDGGDEGSQQTTRGERRTTRAERPVTDGGDARGEASGRSAEGERAGRDDGAEHNAPTLDAALPETSFDERARPRSATPSSAVSTVNGARRRVRAGGRADDSAARGRYVRARAANGVGGVVACDATLRAVALDARARVKDDSPNSPPRVRAEDLRFKRFRRKEGALYILAVDASGSMAANRIGQAKGALARLLRTSYVRRDRVALVAFRGDAAQTLLPPSSSSARARAALDALKVGGATPLPSALLRALEIVRRERARGARDMRLVLFTDGRANVPLAAGVEGADARRQVALEVERLGAEIRRAGVETLVVDTRERFTSAGEGDALALALGGRYTRLPSREPGDAFARAFDR